MYQNMCKGKQKLCKSGTFATKIAKNNPLMNRCKLATRLLGHVLLASVACLSALPAASADDVRQRITYNRQTPESVVINEIMVANVDMFLDKSYDYGGYVELYNPTDLPVRLLNMYVSDDPAEPLKFRLKAANGVIPAHGFATVWFDHNDADGDYMAGAMAQVPWKLSYNGGTVCFSDKDGNVIASQAYPAGITRVSYARKTDGGEEWGYTSTPSPGASNAGSVFCESRAEAPVPDRDGGLFTESFTLKVAFPAGVTLRYTTDGSTPTLANGKTSLTGSFRVKSGSSAVYRFRTFAENALPSAVVTRSFIYRDKAYTLPIASIVSSPDNLYNDTTGIMIGGKYNNYNKDWDRPVNFELFDIGRDVACLNQECDMAISGAFSRNSSPRPFRLKASRQYEGKNTFDYPVFDLKKHMKLRSIKFRNGGNDISARLTDAAVQQIIQTSGMYLDGQLWQPAHVFINGSYHGMLNMREASNKFFAYSNYGLDEDNLDAFEIDPTDGYVQDEGDNRAYLRWYELSKSCADDNAYREICEIVDIDEYANYMAAECWVGSNDWLVNSNNIKAFRERTGDKSDRGKFHFVMYDMDAAFATDNLFTDIKSKASAVGLSQKFGLAQILVNMLDNETFRQKFVTAYCIVAGSVFEPGRCSAIINSMMDTIRPALALENCSPDSRGKEIINAITDTSRRARRMSALANFLNLKSGRQLSFSANIPQARFMMNGEPVPTAKFSGTVYASPELEVSAPAGYNFSGWRRMSDNKVLSTNRKFVYSRVSGAELVAEFTPLADADLLDAGAAPVVINEVSASNDIFANEYFKRNDWIELYNNTSDDVDVAGMFLSDNPDNPCKYRIEGGDGVSTVLPANGYLVVWCDKLDPVSAVHAPFKLANDDHCCVCLTAADGSWSDRFHYDSHEGTRSVGRYPDGGKRVYDMAKPTIGTANFISSQAVYMHGDDSDYVAGVSTGVSEAATAGGTVRCYTPSGMQTESPQRGINIVVDADGTVRKVLGTGF